MNNRTLAVDDLSLNLVIDLNGELAAGLYLVNLTIADRSFTQRLVIQ